VVKLIIIYISYINNKSMTTFYCCDLNMNGSNLTQEEKDKEMKKTVKEDKKRYRLFMKIIGKPLDIEESDSNDEIKEEIKEIIAQPTYYDSVEEFNPEKSEDIIKVNDIISLD